MAEKLRIERITTDPDPYEPFRLALGYRIGDLLCDLRAGVDRPEGEIVGAGDFDAQAEQTFRNLEARARRPGGRA